MRILKVKKSINIFALIYLLITWFVLGITFIDYVGLVDMEEKLSKMIIVGAFISSVIILISELRKILSKEEVVNISEEGIKCVNYPSQTIAFIKWDAVIGVDYEIAWSKSEYNKVIVFVNGRFKGRCGYYPVRNPETNKERVLKAVIINTSDTNKTRKIYKTITHNMMIEDY